MPVAHQPLGDGQARKLRRPSVGSTSAARAVKTDPPRLMMPPISVILAEAEPEGAAAHQREGQDVLDEHEAREQPVVEAGADQRRVIVEQAVGDGDAERQQDEAVREGESDAGQQQHAGAADSPMAMMAKPKSSVARSVGSSQPDALRIKARRAEPDPVEKGGLHGDRRGVGEGEAAIFRQAQKLRDEQPDREIEQDVAEKGDENRHGRVRAWRSRASRRSGGRRQRHGRLAAILVARGCCQAQRLRRGARCGVMPSATREFSTDSRRFTDGSAPRGRARLARLPPPRANRSRSGHAHDVTLPAAALAGLLSFLSPCVLPLVPPYLIFIAGTTIEERRRRRARARARARHPGRRRAVRARLLDGVRGARRQRLGRSARCCARISRLLSALAGVAIILMGLHFLGLFRFAPAVSREARVEVQKPVGLWGAYVMGLAFAFGWTPCIGPILAAILAVAASEETVGKGAGAARGLFARPRRSVSSSRRWRSSRSRAASTRFKRHFAHCCREGRWACLLVLTGIALPHRHAQPGRLRSGCLADVSGAALAARLG